MRNFQIVLVGDGFPTTAQFKRYANELRAFISDLEPFKSRLDKITFWHLEMDNAGCFGDGVWHNILVNVRMSYIAGCDEVLVYAACTGGELTPDWIFLIHNSDDGLWTKHVTAGDDFKPGRIITIMGSESQREDIITMRLQTTLHEFGHAFGLLPHRNAGPADESNETNNQTTALIQ